MKKQDIIKNMNFNKQLLLLYLDSDLNQQEFAKKTRQSFSSINHWLNNHQDMSFKKFEEVCENLNLKIKVTIEQ
jgi:transcriptional regulator with XRE-family HTH domain